MTAFIIVVIALLIFEARKMYKDRQRKELIIYIALTLLSIVFAVYFYQSSNDQSLSGMILELFNIEY